MSIEAANDALTFDLREKFENWDGKLTIIDSLDSLDCLFPSMTIWRGKKTPSSFTFLENDSPFIFVHFGIMMMTLSFSIAKPMFYNWSLISSSFKQTNRRMEWKQRQQLSSLSFFKWTPCHLLESTVTDNFKSRNQRWRKLPPSPSSRSLSR